MVGIFQGEKTSTNPFCTINSDWQLNVIKAVGIVVVEIFQQTSVRILVLRIPADLFCKINSDSQLDVILAVGI